ncbi:hypothetical protein TNCV_1942921 [Trichonephila clavipes]|nr:hypothetical protein TNCV_1942921 [Trichonephila clavipes]
MPHKDNNIRTYDFRIQKIYRFQPGSNPQFWVYEAGHRGFLKNVRYGCGSHEVVSGVVISSVRVSMTLRTATAGSDVVQSGRPIFDEFFQHLWPYIGNNTANIVFQMVKRLWLIRIDQ